MAGDRTQHVQDIFLNTLRKKKVPLTVYLGSGVKLQGIITSFDSFSFILKRGPQMQLVYKHAVATVVPSEPISLYEEQGYVGAAGHPRDDHHSDHHDVDDDVEHDRPYVRRHALDD